MTLRVAGLAASQVLPSGLSLPSPTLTGNITGAIKDYAKTAIPFVMLSSGSVSAAGAITGITALPVAYPAAYCHFPANALATAIAAGWYFCTFSTTTAGTAFLNTYTSGLPTIPASPTAVTDGKGAFTAVITEQTALTITLTGGSMGASGRFETDYLTSATNNANVKTVRVKFAGTQVSTLGPTGSGSGRKLSHVANRGNTAVQVTDESITTAFGGLGIATATPNYMAIDTTADVAVTITLQKATATDNLVLEDVSMTVKFGA